MSLVRCIQASETIHVATQKKIKNLFEQQEQILADCGTEIQNHEFQADKNRRNIPKLNGVIESEINRALARNEQLRRELEQN